MSMTILSTMASIVSVGLASLIWLCVISTIQGK